MRLCAKYINFLFLIVLNHCFSQDRLHSDIVDGPANIRDKPNGKILFELFDGVAVTTTMVKDNWYQVGVHCKLNELNQIEKRFKENSYILNTDGDTIGKAKSFFKYYSWESKTEGFLSGWTYIDNIKKKLIPEVMLSDLIKNKNFKSREDFKNFIEQYHFKLYGPHRDLLSEIAMYYIYETVLTDVTPGFRISLLFKKNNLVGIIHTRPIHIENSITEKLMIGYSLTVIDNCLNDLFLKKLKNSIIEFLNKTD